MRRIGIIGVLSMLLVAFSASVALAQNPHFINASGTVNNNGSLTVSFKEAGLGDNQLISYVLTADATATYVCVNRGGANPSAQNKTTVSGPVSATGTFSSGKNGQVTESIPGTFDTGCLLPNVRGAC